MTKSSIFTPILIAGCAILILNFLVRASFGVFQIPVATEFGWMRSDFSMAIAVQNLAWGIGQPIFGALAERFGDRRAIILGALMYSAGLLLSSYAVTPGQMQALEILVGFGIAGTGFGVILAIVGRAAKPEQRSLALGIATAAGSAGQVFGAPVAQALLTHCHWQTVFVIFSAVILLTFGSSTASTASPGNGTAMRSRLPCTSRPPPRLSPPSWPIFTSVFGWTGCPNAPPVLRALPRRITAWHGYTRFKVAMAGSRG